MKAFETEIKTFSYVRTKILMAMHSILEGYEYGLKDSIDSIIDSNPEYFQKTVKTKFWFFTSVEVSVTEHASKFYKDIVLKINNIDKSIKDAFLIEDKENRQGIIKTVVMESFESFSEYLIIQDILQDRISWSECDRILYPSSLVNHLKFRHQMQTEVMESRYRMSRRYNFNTYYEDDGLDFWEIYFITEMISNDYYDISYLDECGYYDDSALTIVSVEEEGYVNDVIVEGPLSESDIIMGSTEDIFDVDEEVHEFEADSTYEATVDDTEESNSCFNEIDHTPEPEPEPEPYYEPEPEPSYESSYSDDSSSYDSDCGDDD